MNNELITKNLQHHIVHELKGSKRFRIISPFVKKEIVDIIIRHVSPSNIQLITRFNEADFTSGVSDIEGLEKLFLQGAQIFGVKNLHSKVYLFDSCAIISSGNMTSGGFRNNHECGMLTREPNIIEELNKYFETLWKSRKLDKTLLEELRKNITKLKANYNKPKLGNAKNHGASIQLNETNFFFVNIGYVTRGKIQEERNWEDFRQFNFISAGQGRAYSDSLYKLKPGNVVFAYVSTLGEIGGYIGVGIVQNSAVRVTDFKYEKRPLSTYKNKLKGDVFRNSGDPDLSEYLVKVNWLETKDLKKGYKTKGKYYFYRSVLCSLENHMDTVDWLLKKFNLPEDTIPKSIK